MSQAGTGTGVRFEGGGSSDGEPLGSLDGGPSGSSGQLGAIRTICGAASRKAQDQYLAGWVSFLITAYIRVVLLARISVPLFFSQINQFLISHTSSTQRQRSELHHQYERQYSS